MESEHATIEEPTTTAESAGSTTPSRSFAPLRYDLVIIGEGPVAAAAAREAAVFGCRTAVVARELLGPGSGPDMRAVEDALWAAACACAGSGRDFGGHRHESRGDVWPMLRAGLDQAMLAGPPASAGSIAEPNVDLLIGEASFVGRRVISVAGRSVRFRYALLAPECRTRANGIDGRGAELCWRPTDLARLACIPRRLAIVGVGPRECIWAQSLCRLGSEVHVFGRESEILPGELPAAAAIVRRRLEDEGVRFHFNYRRLEVQPLRQQRLLIVEEKGGTQKRFVDAVLVDDVREIDLEPLRLAAAGVRVSAGGVVTDRRLRTTNRRIFAAGDICRGYGASGDTAEAAARVCVRQAMAARWDGRGGVVIARRVGTDPAIVCLGQTPEELDQGKVAWDIYRVELDELASFEATAGEEGFVEIYVRRATGGVLGACVVASDADALAGPLMLLARSGLCATALDTLIASRSPCVELLGKLADRQAAGHCPRWSLWLGESLRAWIDTAREQLRLRLLRGG